MQQSKIKACATCTRKVVFRNLNIARHVCNHLLGESHSMRHRMLVGAIIMLAGVLLSKAGEHSYALHVVSDMGGYLVHGIGAIPFIERLSKTINS